RRRAVSNASGAQRARGRCAGAPGRRRNLRTRQPGRARACAAGRAAEWTRAALGLRPLVGEVPLRRGQRLVQLAAAPAQGGEFRAARVVRIRATRQLPGMNRMLDRARALLQKAKRRSWMKYALRGVGANDNFERLDLAYSIEDPWNMDSPTEQARFEST